MARKYNPHRCTLIDYFLRVSSSSVHWFMKYLAKKETHGQKLFWHQPIKRPPITKSLQGKSSIVAKSSFCITHLYRKCWQMLSQKIYWQDINFNGLLIHKSAYQLNGFCCTLDQNFPNTVQTRPCRQEKCLCVTLWCLYQRNQLLRKHNHFFFQKGSDLVIDLILPVINWNPWPIK